MARSLNFQHKYPYSVWEANSRFRMAHDTGQTYLSGNYTYPLTFQVTYPHVVKLRVTLYAENNAGTSILNRSWYLYLYNGSSWYAIHTFTMPLTGTNPSSGKQYGEYTWEGTVGYSGVRKFAAVPTAQMSSGTTWTNGITIEGLWVQETLTTVDLVSTDYVSGLFTNQSGVQQKPSQVNVNMGGVITKATKVLVNMGGVLTELPPAYNGAYTTTTPDSMRVYEFTPPATGTYKVDVVRNSGDHEARMYSSTYAQIHPNGSSGNPEGSYFYSGEFTLTAGALYLISLIHYPPNTTTADSVLFITKI